MKAGWEAFLVVAIVGIAVSSVALGSALGRLVQIVHFEKAVQDCRSYKKAAAGQAIALDCGIVIDGKPSEFPWRQK